MVTQEKTGKSPCDTPKKATVERDDLYLCSQAIQHIIFYFVKKTSRTETF